MTTHGRARQVGGALRLAAAGLGAVIFAHAALAQSTVELRASAVVPMGAPVRLSDIAALSGPDAETLADTVVIEDPAERVRAPSAGGRSACVIDIEEVRRALKARPGGAVRWSALTLRGWRCTIAGAGTRVQEGPESPAIPAPIAAEAAADTVRSLIGVKLAEVLGAGLGDMRLDFDAGDAAVLDAPAGGGAVEIVPMGLSDRMPLSVTIYDGDRVRLSKSIRVGVQVRRAVAVAAAAKRRGDTIAEGDVKVEDRWVGPTLRRAAPERVMSAVARSRIAAGAIITESDVEQPAAVKKGERVEVHCVSGRLVVKTRARAMAAGREGDVVMFESLDGTKRTFAARVDGKGRAVTSVGPEGGGSTEKGTP